MTTDWVKPRFTTEKKSRHPDDVVMDESLSEEEKLKALKNLEEDHKALMRADDEAMTRPIEPELTPAELLANVKKAEQQLSCHDSPKPH